MILVTRDRCDVYYKQLPFEHSTHKYFSVSGKTSSVTVFVYKSWIAAYNI